MKKTSTIFLLVISIIIISSLLVTNTYSLINNINNNISDIFIKDNIYTNEYYIVKDKLNISDNDMLLIINSLYINKLYDYILNHNLNKEELSKIINKYILLDNSISDELKSNIINTSKKYIDDIYNYYEKKRK